MRRTIFPWARKRTRGHTLVEAAVVLTLAAVALVTVAQVEDSGARAFEAGTEEADLDQTSRRALDRIAKEIKLCDDQDLGPFPQTPLWDNLLEFDRVVDVSADNGDVTWQTVRIEFVFDAVAAALNPDERGTVVMTIDPGGPDEQAIQLADSVRQLAEGELLNGADDNGNGLVDESGFALEWDGTLMRILLTVESLPGDDEATAARTTETAIRLRN